MSSPIQQQPTRVSEEILAAEAHDPARRTFADGAGRQWTLRLDYDTSDELRNKFKVDVGDVQYFTKTWSQILWDDQLSLKLLWHLIAEQAGETTEKDFRRSMDGGRLDDARLALLAAGGFFTPAPKPPRVTPGTTWGSGL